MADPIMTDIAGLFDQHTEDSFVDEASRFPTVPSALYEGRIDQREIFQGGTNADFKDTFERQYARLSFPAHKDGKKLGRVSFNISWEEKRNAQGRQDRLFQSYNQIKGALGLKGKSVGDVLDGMMSQPLAYVVQELYQRQVNAVTIADALVPIVEDAAVRDSQIRAFDRIRSALSGESPYARAAGRIVELMGCEA